MKNKISIKYDMSSNYFRCYNEAQGVMVDKKKILKKLEGKIYGYLERFFSYFLFTTLLFIVALVLKMQAFYILFYILYGLLCFYAFIFACGYLTEAKKKHVGELVFDKDGIVDIGDNGIQVQMKWEHILGVVIQKYTVTILTDDMIFFFINNSCKEQVKDAIDKYHKDLLVIDRG